MDLMAFMQSMGQSDIPLVAAFFIGLMTSLSPCPLGTNIVAISYISKKVKNKKRTLLVGILYTLGRAVSYALVASLIVWAGLSMQSLSNVLQSYGEKILGPFLILIGVLMLDLFKIKIPSAGQRGEKIKEKLSQQGYLGGFLLGAIFALSFCPFSAVLFFGMLIPLSLATNDALVLPAVFALGTGLPVLVFSILLVYSVSFVGKSMDKLQEIQRWFQKLVAIIFVLIGLYYVQLAYLSLGA